MIRIFDMAKQSETQQINQNKMKISFSVLLIIFSLAVFVCPAQVRLPQLISDGMVLQRDTKLNLWGWASPHEHITIRFNHQTTKIVADAAGDWKTILQPMSAGGPYVMDISASNHIALQNILVGDVWFCSGQSNMVLNMERVKERYLKEIASADYPLIRNFFVSTVADVARVHQDLPAGKWVAVNPTEVLTFGAVSYFFAKDLYSKYKIPIGIINSSVGGTPIQAWISADGIKSINKYADRLNQFKDTAYLNRLLNPIKRAPLNNIGYKEPDKGLSGTWKWYDVNYQLKGWHNFWLPGYWADQGVKGLNGVVWFRKEIMVPARMAGKPAKLFLGRIVDADETYVNGVKVGNITYQYPPRRYVIPAGVIKPGSNLIVVRVTNTAGKGGFVPDKRYELTDDTTSIDLRGDWQYRVGQVFDPIVNKAGDVIPFSAQNEPTGLYNAMVEPVTKYSVKGFVWYQGESNTASSKEYSQLLPALIADWRSKWKRADLPFIYAQLPNFMEVQYSPSESQWAEVREAEMHALSIPKLGMAVTIDAGEWNDVHPLDKMDVGHRLALAAEKVAYGEQRLVFSGPIFQSATVNGDKIIISFSNIGSGLIIKDGDELNQFAIAGADKKFVWANAIIDGDKVIVSNKDIPNPMYVRYAWADNPEGANLYNREGLPASPFRTDDQ
ncbi:MAG: sialate O-acetylesterase [Bacteroidota bacterium]|nr:sialate O-acetylesterase [Bacteroidota bacterium]